jgi:hypothetical protein
MSPLRILVVWSCGGVVVMSVVGDRIVLTIETVSTSGGLGKHLFECVAIFAG